MDGYLTRTQWRPIDGYAHVGERVFETLAEAEQLGMSLGCCAGSTRVEVFSPDGTLQSLWDKESTVVIRDSSPYFVDEDTGQEFYGVSHVSSRWQRLGAESKALGAAEQARSIALFSQRHARTQPPTSKNSR